VAAAGDRDVHLELAVVVAAHQVGRMLLTVFVAGRAEVRPAHVHHDDAVRQPLDLLDLAPRVVDPVGFGVIAHAREHPLQLAAVHDRLREVGGSAQKGGDAAGMASGAVSAHRTGHP
jgi:anti-sigma-K factor RskA